MSCAECTGALRTQCKPSLCKPGYTWNAGTSLCQKDCTGGLTYNSANNSCCDISCVACSGSGASACTSCLANQYLEVVSSPAGSCRDCDPTCGG